MRQKWLALYHGMCYDRIVVILVIGSYRLLRWCPIKEEWTSRGYLRKHRLQYKNKSVI